MAKKNEEYKIIHEVGGFDGIPKDITPEDLEALLENEEKEEKKNK